MKRAKPTLSQQIQKTTKKPFVKKTALDGNTEIMVSTGSTLLDLAISGGRKKGGGLPGGILIEIFGPSSTGKTVLLSEIAGAVQRLGGDTMFHDPEARLNKGFAKLFGFTLKKESYHQSDTVTEVFIKTRAWVPEEKGKIHAIFADSLAALSTNLEMDSKDGDKMGMRRAKEFSEELRKTARILVKKNWLMVCSNQIRENADAGGYGEKHSTPGGKAVGFYASLRLRTKLIEKIKVTKTISGKEVVRIIGVKIEIEVYKSSVDKPFRKAPLYILFDYGVDDIRANLQYLKDFKKTKTYAVGGVGVGVAMNDAIRYVESKGLEDTLKQEVIELWEEIEAKFVVERKIKQR